MIARLVGDVVDATGDTLVVDVGGVGYEVQVPARTAAATGRVTLHVYTKVTQDAITLYGFSSAQEKACFELIVGVSNVGPKTGLAVLSSLTPDALARAIESNDLRTLSGCNGVGKKTAERLVLELRGKLGFVALTPAPARVAKPEDPLPLALAQLGYKKSEIDAALAVVPSDGPLDARMKAALSHFMAAR
ncbi:MAG: Holliday junction branch migration protein RuvA [Myxococcota bacterium]